MTTTNTDLVLGGLYRKKNSIILIPAICVGIADSKNKDVVPKLMWLTGSSNNSYPMIANWIDTHNYEYIGMVDWLEIEARVAKNLGESK